MKKNFSVIYIFLAFTLTVCCLFCANKKVSFASESTALSVESKSAYLVEPNSGTVIYKYNENEKRPIASMCKIMTLLLTFEEIDKGNLSFDTLIPISENASGMGGSQVFLESNAEYRAEELIKSIVVASANDSCVAMAEYICGSESEFVNKMNKRAKELNMNDTVFVNCTGLPKLGQFSTAKDVSVMFSNLLTHKDYFRFSGIWMDEISHPKGRKTEISNTNKLIRFYDGCDSGKTGYTSEAGHCLSASAERDGMRLVSVVICAPDSKTRFRDISAMFNFGFANYTNKMIVDDEKPLEIKVNVSSGKKDSIEVVAENKLYLFSLKNQSRAVQIDFEPLEEVKAPVNKGDVVGKLVVYENGVKINSVNVISNESVDRATYFDYLKDIINNWNLF